MPDQEKQAEKFLATSDEYAQFLQSNVWRDLEGALKRRVHGYETGELRSLEGIPLYKTQGAANELDFVIALPRLTQAVLAKHEEIDRRKAEIQQPKET